MGWKTEYNQSKLEMEAFSPDPSPVEKWVDLKYPSDSGLLAKLEKVGFKVAWCSDRILARRVDLEGWEVVVEQDAQGVPTMYRLKDRPSDQTLIKKRLRPLDCLGN